MESNKIVFESKDGSQRAILYSKKHDNKKK